MSNFIQNAMRRIRAARNHGQVEKTFDAICNECASKNLLDCTCDSCPLEQVVKIKEWTLQTLEDQYRKVLDN